MQRTIPNQLKRRAFLRSLGLGFAALAGTWLGLGSGRARDASLPGEKLGLHRSRWRELLPESAYRILFEEGTERPYTSPFNEQKAPGTYRCRACYLPLFASETKYDSGTGWPSFWAPIPDRLGTKTDLKMIFPRTEYHCARCEGHQGHIFSDGPKPTGLRYCNNGVALRFVPKSDPLPALREQT
jgi:peptide-methionine (R)-S-oxide reductase